MLSRDSSKYCFYMIDMFDAKFGSIAVTHTSFLGPRGYGTYYVHPARVGLVDSTLKGA